MKKDLTVVGLLRQSYDQLVKENKELKRKLDEESKLWSELKKENKELKKFEKAAYKQDKDLRRKFLNLKEENRNLKEENKELKDTMNQMVKEAWKLKQLVDKLREAIEEEKNWAKTVSKTRMFVRSAIARMDGKPFRKMTWNKTWQFLNNNKNFLNVNIVMFGYR